MPEIRRPTRAEHDAVADLTALTYLAEGWADEEYLPELRDIARRDTLARVLVAVEDGQVVGAVTLATEGGPYAERCGPGDAVIRHLVTAPAARGRGIGEALVHGCVEAARQAGCRQVKLSSMQGQHAAHRLYERLGFTRTPHNDWSFSIYDLRTYALALVPYCDQCGEELLSGPHSRCTELRRMDPPRWCPHCKRRMVVQILPHGWSAKCSRHGMTYGGLAS